ncbi:MAG TPA: hypothetical protein VEB40_00680 [Flavipsychrobacter sp.]|nr:hypothetical protein [Flavipsychrobacter sp.]
MKTELTIVAKPAAESFAAAMGIGVSRERQICDLIEECYDGTDTYPQAIACLSQMVNSINELGYALFHLGAFAGSEQAKREMIKTLES